MMIEYVKRFERNDTFEKVKKDGFDIQEDAKWLEEFYREALEER